MRQIILSRDINTPTSKKFTILSPTQRDNMHRMGIKVNKNTTEAEALRMLKKRKQ